MARYDASINLLVSGQQKVERLLSSVDRLQGAIESIKSTPIDLNVRNYNRQLKQEQDKILGVNQKINKLQDDRIKTIEKIAKLNERIARQDKILESAGPQTKKAENALRVKTNAIRDQLKLQDQLNESIAQSNKLAATRSDLVSNRESLRALRQEIDFAKTLADTYLKYGDARKYAEGKGFAPKGDLVRNETSIAQVKQQAATFDSLAKNTRIASKEFNRFTIAAELASQKAKKSELRQFSVLAEAFAPEGQRGIKPIFGKDQIAGARNAVASLISFFPEVAKSEAALSSYASELESLRSLVPIASSEFIQLSNAIKVVGDELSRVGDVNRQFGPSQFIDVKPSGPVSDRLNSLKQQRKYAEDVNREYRRQTDLAEEISRAAIGVTDREALSLRLNRALDALGENRLEDAQAITREVQKQLKLQKELLSSKPTRVFGVAGQDFMPISGAMAAPAGIRNLAAPGSPAARRLEQEAIAAWVQRGGPALPEAPRGALRTPIKGSVDIPGSPKYEERRLDIASKIEGIQKRILLSTASDRAQQELLNEVYAARNALLEGNFGEAKRIANQIDRNRFAYERQNKALDDEKSRRQTLQNQFRKLETLQNNYLLLEQKGVRFQEEKIQLQDILAKAIRNPEKVTKDYVNSLDQAITKFRILAGQRVSEAKLAGAYITSKPQSAETIEKSRKNILGEALGVEKQLLDLELKGYDVTTQKLEVQDAIARLKQLEGKSTTATNDALRAQVSTLRLLTKEEGNRAFVAEGQRRKSESADEAFKKINRATDLVAAAEQRLTGLENTRELGKFLDEYTASLKNQESINQSVLDAEKQAIKQFDDRIKAADKFKDQLLSIQKLQSDYTTAEKAGAQFLQEKLDLQELVNAAAGGQIEASAENVRLLDSQIGRFKKFLALRISEAKSTGAYAQAARPQTAEKIEATRRRLLDQALGVQRQLITLDQNGGKVAQDKIEIEKLILDVKNKQNSSTQAENELLAQQIGLLKTAAKEEANRLAALPKASGGKAAGPEGTGLEAALKRLEEARGARQKFLGDVSAPEAIDKIVREFNKDSTTGTASEAAQAAENVVSTYASKIAAGVPAVADAMMKLGKAGIDAIKKALGIASPSKVMLAIAKNQIDTYVDFLRAALPQVEAAAKAIGEAGAPKPAGVPESAIRRPFTEKARTRPLTAQQLDRNSVIAEYAAAQIAGPTRRFEQVKRKIEDFIDKTRTTVDLDKLFGGQENERLAMAAAGKSAGPEFDKIRAALADFYQIPAELTPDLERGVKAAGDASTSADELTKYVSELTTGIEQIGVLLQSAAKLPIPAAAAPAVAVDDEFTRAQEAAAKADAAAAEAARKKAEAQKPFEASIQRAAELDAEAKRKADSAVSSVVQAQIEADAKAGAEAISKAILDPIESAAPEGERQVRSAIGNLFDRVAGALGFGGAGGGGRPPVPPTGGGGGPTRNPGDFNRRLSTAAEQGAEALLGLRELRDPTKATTVELEALSGVLKEFRKILDPTSEGFERLEKQLRETAANLDRQLERRAPDAGFLTRQFGPRTARGLSEGLIGGAFPLLFGQGLGAAVGGAAGGFGGGFAGGGLGFGLSLVGTALGTAFDTAVQSAQELGRALEKPVENFDQLAQQSFFSSKALEDTIKKTIEYGDSATASALIQEEAIKKLGVGGVQNLKVLGTESDRLNRAFAELGQQMQAVAAGPLASVIGFFANIAGQAAAAGRVRLLRANLNEQQAGQFNQEILQRLQQQGIQRGFFAPSAPTDAEIGMLLERGALQDIVDKWQAIEVQGKIKLDPKQKIESEINALQKQLEAIDIGKSLLDQVRSVNREQEDLDRQRAELVRSYEESIGNIRKQVEDRIADERRKNAQLELDIRAAAADLQLEKIKEANREFRGIFSDTLAGQTTERILDAVETITQIQNDGASQRANLELQIQNTAIETEKYKVEIANQVAKLNEETARRVDDINLSVRRRNEEYDQNRFTLEKRIAELQLKNNEILTTQQLDTAKKQLEAAKRAGDTQQQAYAKTFVDIYQSQLDIVQKGQQEVGAISAPSKLKGVPAGVVGGGSVGTSGIDQAVNSGIRLQQALQGVQDQIRSVNSVGALANIEESLEKQIKQAELLFFEFEMGGGARSKDLAAQGNLIDAINAKLGEQQDKMSPLSEKLRELLQFENGRFKIINLINEATAADVQVKTLEDLISKENELKILIEEAKRGSQGLSEVDRTRLILQQAGLDIENEKVRAILTQAAAVDALNEKYKKLTADQQMQKELLDGIAGTFANTVGGAIDAAVSGTENFGEALKGLAADMFKTIARMLMMYAIAQALGALGGNDKGVGFFSTLARGFGFKESANGSYFANGIAAFANGGMFTNSVVSSPTLFKFADGGTMQTGVMGEAGPEAIMPLKRGPGGRLGVDASGSGGDNIVVTVNVDAKGSSVQGDDQRGNQLGRAISAAVQQELIKQKRPGGLLA